MRWLHVFGLALACVAGLTLSACGVLPGSAPAPTPTSAPAAPSVAPAAAPSAAPKPSAAVSPVASPSPQAAPSSNAAATPTPAVPTVYVGNTDGEGVYVRNTPVMSDRAQAYPDGTALVVVGPDVEGDGQHWKHIKTPDGLEGYVPTEYTTDTPQ
jgi:hypothetical protein